MREINRQAFPCMDVHNHNGVLIVPAQSGITLRQYYVAKIMQGEISKHGIHNTSEEEVCLAFNLADMINQYEQDGN